MPDHSNVDPLDKLMHISCELPCVLETADALLARGPGTEKDRAEVTGALISTLSNLYAWQTELRKSSLRPFYTTVPAQLWNPTDDERGSRLFPFAIRFRSL